MKFVYLFLVCGVLLAACLPAAPAPAKLPPTAAALPPHSVAKVTAILNGFRVEIHTWKTDLSKDECLALLKAYRSRAGEAGQVSVRKPDASGELRPWCVDNLDGTPVIFNDAYFK